MTILSILLLSHVVYFSIFIHIIVGKVGPPSVQFSLTISSKKLNCRCNLTICANRLLYLSARLRQDTICILAQKRHFLQLQQLNRSGHARPIRPPQGRCDVGTERRDTANSAPSIENIYFFFHKTRSVSASWAPVSQGRSLAATLYARCFGVLLLLQVTHIPIFVPASMFFA